MEKEIAARKAELKRFVFDAKSSDQGTAGVRESGVSVAAASADAFKIVTSDRAISLGDRVLTGFGKVGTVEKIEGEIAEVLVGSMRLREKVKNLKAVSNDSIVQTKKPKVKIDTKALDERLETSDYTPELNLIGKRTAEAEYMLDKFLDESYMSSLRHIRIIHGFGTGAMRNFVQQFLRHHEHVLRYTFAEPNQGGEGATVVELKQ